MNTKDQEVLKKVIDLLQKEYGNQYMERTGSPELKLRFVLATFEQFSKALERNAWDQTCSSPAFKFLSSELD